MNVSKKRNCDIISTLPDDVLCHILSFLETKHVVRLSVLSTQWKKLFYLVPSLSFQEFYVDGEQEKNHDSFINFVYRMLLTYKLTDMHSFIVKYEFFNALNSHIHSWVSAAIIRNVCELCLTIYSDNIVWLPRNLFNSKTLVEVVLDGNFCLNLDNSMCLPNLKKLYLVKMHIHIEGSNHLSFSIFPVLEDLILDCDYDQDVSIDLAIFSLKKLKLMLINEVPNVVLNTPVLEVLEFIGEIGNICGNVLASLVKASFAILPPFESVDGFHNLIKMCSNVHDLYLYEHSMEALRDYEMTRFQNLTSIKIALTSSASVGWKLLPILLENSPNLQILIFKGDQCPADEDVEMEHLLAIRDCGKSLSMHFKKLQFRYFTGLEYQFKLMEYILKNVKVLKKVIIHSRKPLESQQLVIQRLIAFPRCSKECEFTVINQSHEMLKRKYASL